MTEMERARKERRFRIASVDQETVLGVFRPHQLGYFYLSELPEDVEIVSVRHEWPANRFDFLVCHPSFDPVPDGEPAPYHHGLHVLMRRKEAYERAEA